MEGKKRKVYVSKIMQWYHSDFGYRYLLFAYRRTRKPLTCSFSDRRTDEEMLGWIASFAPDEKANLLKEWLATGKVKVAYLPYDWGQNKKAS